MMKNAELENIAQVEGQVEGQETNVEATESKRHSNHVNHANCVELRGLLEQVSDWRTVQVNRGKKVEKICPLITEKEAQLIDAFVSTDYNVKQTATKLGFSHTNVWQRLYGTPKKEKPAKGILGKLREYVAAQESDTVDQAV